MLSARARTALVSVCYELLLIVVVNFNQLHGFTSDFLSSTVFTVVYSFHYYFFYLLMSCAIDKLAIIGF